MPFGIVTAHNGKGFLEGDFSLSQLISFSLTLSVSEPLGSRQFSSSLPLASLVPFSYIFQVALIFSHVTFPSRVFPLCFLRGGDDSPMKHKLHVPQSQETLHGFTQMDLGFISPLLLEQN